MGILSIWDSNSANSCLPGRDQAPRPAVDMSSFDSPQQSNDNITDQYFLGGATTWKTYSWVASPPHLYTPGAILIATWYMLASHAIIFLRLWLIAVFYTHKSYLWLACMVRSFGTCDVRMLAQQA